jgi:hypothetical protein
MSPRQGCQLRAGAFRTASGSRLPEEAESNSQNLFPKTALKGHGFSAGPGSIRVPACGIRRLAEQGFPARRRKLHARTRALPGGFSPASISETL